MDSSSCHCPLPNQHGKKVCGSKRQLDTCTCREEPRLTQETPQETPPTYISYVPQQPGPLTRSASHVSLVVAAEPTIVAPSRSEEGTFKISTLPRTLVAPYLRQPYRNIYPETPTGPQTTGLSINGKQVTYRLNNYIIFNQLYGFNPLYKFTKLN